MRKGEKNSLGLEESKELTEREQTGVVRPACSYRSLGPLLQPRGIPATALLVFTLVRRGYFLKGAATS